MQKLVLAALVGLALPCSLAANDTDKTGNKAANSKKADEAEPGEAESKASCCFTRLACPRVSGLFRERPYVSGATLAAVVALAGSGVYYYNKTRPAEAE